MAVEAARDCLVGQDAADVSTPLLASTSAPFADRQNPGIVKEALTLPDAVLTLHPGTSQQADPADFNQAFRSASSGRTLLAAPETVPPRPASKPDLAKPAHSPDFLAGHAHGSAPFL